MVYPAGFWGWKIAARLGVPISIVYSFGYDKEAKVFYGHSVNLKGVLAEGKTRKALFNNIHAATQDILELELNGKSINFKPEFKEINAYAFA